MVSHPYKNNYFRLGLILMRRLFLCVHVITNYHDYTPMVCHMT